MAAFGLGGVTLRDTGAAAEVVTLTGSKFPLVLQFTMPDSNGVAMPHALDGWSLSSVVELREGEYLEDSDKLEALHDVMQSDPLTAPTVSALRDQNANPGIFTVEIEDDLLPLEIAREITVDETTLPTVCIWVVFTSPGGDQIEQARIAVGYRRGVRSLQ